VERVGERARQLVGRRPGIERARAVDEEPVRKRDALGAHRLVAAEDAGEREQLGPRGADAGAVDGRRRAEPSRLVGRAHDALEAEGHPGARGGALELRCPQPQRAGAVGVGAGGQGAVEAAAVGEDLQAGQRPGHAPSRLWTTRSMSLIPTKGATRPPRP
jgi:hypothetical protein